VTNLAIQPSNAIICLTEAGLRLANRVAEQLRIVGQPSEVFYKPKPFNKLVQQLFKQQRPLIFICATGIVMRTLAPVLQNKQQDPPVLVLDEQAEFVIPLLSGHEGGANNRAAELADILSAQLVMTTAKPYLKPIYTVGMGCEKGCSAEHMQQLLVDCLAQAKLTIDDISSINSIDIKAQEVGLIELAAQYHKPYKTFDTVQLSQVEALLSTKSDYIFSVVGVYGVAESAALYAAQQLSQDVAELVFNKQKTKKATCAIARSYPMRPQHNYCA